jgi:regulator of sirC expression with transglutaminase-like and TPR domain
VAQKSFEALAADPDARLDELALALAAGFRPVDRAAALAELDRLAGSLRDVACGGPREQAAACRHVLGEQHGFEGERDEYDHPRNSMLDLVLERRRGLPILLSAVYVEVARRAGISLAPVGLPGHFVVAQLSVEPPIVLDPFARGRDVTAEVRGEQIRAWTPHETALRMLTNLVRAYAVRSDLVSAIRAASLRMALPADAQTGAALRTELRALQARLN